MTGVFAKIDQLKTERVPFAVATVIAVRGSASAKPGSKAIINAEGRNILGWVGGGCAEGFVGSQAKEAMAENQTRIVTANLDDEIFGLGMPCGGVMDVFIEPFLPPQRLTLPRAGCAENDMLHLVESFGFLLTSGDEERHFETRGELLHCVASAIGKLRQKSLLPLTRMKVKGRERMQARSHFSEFLVLGNSRITEELANLGAFLNWPVRVFGPQLRRENYSPTVTTEVMKTNYSELVVQRDSIVIVASHHKGDHEFIQTALAARPFYIGLIASPKRAGLVFDYLVASGVSRESLVQVAAPAGLDIGCLNPREIALSVLAEVHERLMGEEFGL